MTIMMAMVSPTSLAAGVVVTVSGESISHAVSNGNTARAGVRFNSDGTVDKLEGTSYTQIDASTDWRIPNGSGAGYYVKFTVPFGGTVDSGTLNTWMELTTARQVYIEHAASDSQETEFVTAHLSDDGGTTTLDTGLFSLTATVGLPP